MPFIDIEERNHKNLMNIVTFFQMQKPYIVTLGMTVMLTENALVSLIYITSMDALCNYRLVAIISGWPNTTKYTIMNAGELNWGTFVGLTLGTKFIRIVVLICFIIFRTKNLQDHNKF